ncbi:chromate transporter [Choiromyces venosus 120613-1]|uniref:Chromate transporter n=1 Tax=Choiromyces venosus 120613-1 TaxID=1336337 RepID=A0A3N4JM28_9PEZI|nr:chromate transporter [Choiromyces venosus 120613-1]
MTNITPDTTLPAEKPHPTPDTKSAEDLESQSCPNSQEVEPPQEEDLGYHDNSNVPRLGYLKLFWLFFYNFGLFAWGGPVAQIVLIKEQLVIKEKWITLARFQRVFAVYQILPGPEAAELCMFFGCLSAGRIGGIIAGLGFILPGFLCMLLASYLYSLAGFENAYFNASFRGVQPLVAAMILRAAHKIADHCVIDPITKKVNPYLIIAGLCTALNTALRINIFISLAFYGLFYAIISRPRMLIPGLFFFILQYVAYAVYVVFRGVPSPVSLALGIAQTPSLINLFVLGLIAGSLSFGGAYTAIPFIQVEAVLKGGWLAQSVFIDCIAIGNVLPAPLVIFATFVGFQGGLADGKGLGGAFAGAIIITLGMFFPCFVFTIAGHEVLEKLVRNKFLARFFDGLCAAVVGVIAVIAVEILKSAVGGRNNGDFEDANAAVKEDMKVVLKESVMAATAAVLYIVGLAVLYRFLNKWTPLLLLAAGAIAGQFLFI